MRVLLKSIRLRFPLHTGKQSLEFALKIMYVPMECEQHMRQAVREEYTGSSSI